VPASFDLSLQGEPLRLLADRAVHWPGAGTLIVADLHWGKAAAFRAESVAVPPGTTSTDVERLTRLLHETGAQHLMVLGDLFHARTSLAAETLSTLRAWRSRWPDVALTLIRGNHDRHAGDPPADLGFQCVEAPHPAGPFALTHHPADADAYVLAGHIHPGVRLKGRGAQRLTLPCFAIGRTRMLLPAFGSFTGLGVVDPGEFERIVVVADSEVIEVPTGHGRIRDCPSAYL
jgi:DNA ligase-associated metallophosphoesterase